MRSCKNCEFNEMGECRRFPPQVGEDSQTEYSSGVFYAFPRVLDNEWCGEFKEKECNES